MSDPAPDLPGQLRQAFGKPLFDAAERLVASGCVQDVRILQAGKVVTGVAVAAGSRWRVYVQYQTPQSILRVIGECSCGEPAPCVHVAAVCIAAARQASSPADQARANAGPRAERRSAPVSQQHRLYYRLEPAAGNAVLLSLWIALPTADARGVQAQTATAFEMRTLAEGHFPRYVDSADQRILRTLLQRRLDLPCVLREQAGELLPAIVATGRAFLRSLQGNALRSGGPRPLSFSWAVSGEGVQRLVCDVPHLLVLLDAEPALYIDSVSGECGQLQSQCPWPVLREYWKQQFPPAAVAASNEMFAQQRSLPALRQIVVESIVLESVRARLLLTTPPACELRYLYNDLLIEQELAPHVATVRVMPQRAGAVLYEMERDHAAERRLRLQLEHAACDLQRGQRVAWLRFMLNSVPALQADGWEVMLDSQFPYRIAPAHEWYTDLQADRERGGWFDLRLGVTVEGQSCDLLPALVKYLQSGQAVETERVQEQLDHETDHVQVDDSLLLRLADGRYLSVPMSRIQRIAATLVELFERDSLNSRQALSLPQSQAGRVLLLDEEPAQLRCDDDHLARLLADLQASSLAPLAAPAGFAATLRPYQEQGLGWLQLLRRCGLGGILADDMGLGKTLQALAHLLLDKQAATARGGPRKPALIVAPVSVIGNWQRETAKFAPELRVVVLHGSRRRESYAAVARCDVLVTGYPQLQLDSEFLLACEFSVVVLDEAQMIKNPRAKVSQVARALRSEQRLCLTGTPLENHLGELWSLLDFLQPGLLGEERQFQRLYRTPIEKEANQQRAAALGRRIAPFMLRRTKDAVASELPEKTQIVELIGLEEQQRDFYDAIRLAMHRRVQEAIAQQGLARSHITMLDALLKLRQACCDPRLVDLDLGPDVASKASIPSAKLQWLMTVLPELAAEGRRVLLFSQFTSMLSLIEAAVQEAAIPYCLLTGATRERDAQVARFQAGEVPLFLISLKAGGTGLNLTAADTVIHYDPWWNPAVEAQATDRAHRIGQRQPVFVYKLIAQDTIEEKILKLQADKHALAAQLYAQQAPLTQLSAAEIAALFSH